MQAGGAHSSSTQGAPSVPPGAHTGSKATKPGGGAPLTASPGPWRWSSPWPPPLAAPPAQPAWWAAGGGAGCAQKATCQGGRRGWDGGKWWAPGTGLAAAPPTLGDLQALAGSHPPQAPAAARASPPAALPCPPSQGKQRQLDVGERGADANHGQRLHCRRRQVRQREVPSKQDRPHHVGGNGEGVGGVVPGGGLRRA